MLDDDFCLIGAVDFTFECPLASGLRGEVVVSEKNYPNCMDTISTCSLSIIHSGHILFNHTIKITV